MHLRAAQWKNELEMEGLGVALIDEAEAFVLEYDSTPQFARLSRVIWFEPIHGSPPIGGVYNDRFSIWTDACTAEIIEGNAML